MFDRPQRGELALLVHIDLSHQSLPDALQEFTELAISAGAEPVFSLTVNRTKLDPKYCLGSGKAEEIKQLILIHQAKLVLVDYALSPSQQRNLEALWQVRVVDRIGLILDIFAQRARTHEGKLQVELAQLEYMSTRLVRGWTHLERQKGGIGLRGPGETQLETDRRLVRDRMSKIKERLVKVRKQRQQSGKLRQKSDVPVVALVGYTNAGKSTLFNRLSGAKVYAKDQLFATLDPTLRRVWLAHEQYIILADTVGFIRDLPHELVDAFRATLEEVSDADLLLHVIDASAPYYRDQMLDVQKVLEDIGASQVPIIEVYNKIDQTDLAPQAKTLPEGVVKARVHCSALTGQGMALLKKILSEPRASASIQENSQVDS